MRILYFVLTCCCIALSHVLHAQTIRGWIIDKVTEVPLVGATVDLPGLETPRGAVTDTAGWFVIKNLRPGRYAVRVRYLGYEDEMLPDVLAMAGKDADLRILMEESGQAIQAVVISGTKKTKPVNKLAKVSAIALNPETVARYSGGRNTNRQNVYAYRYFRGNSVVSTQYQLGFTPDFVYRIQF